MKHQLLFEKYPLFVMEIGRDETDFDSVDAICDYLHERIEAHRCAHFIAVFDHYAHTCRLPEGQVDSDILAAKNVIFCFGLALPCPEVLAVRPRSIGVAETTRGFMISFMETPMPIANTAMEDWAEGLRRADSDNPNPQQAA
ncbi:DUF6858 family protein [Thiorhodovibrio frisius]|uniref:Uncharacterized protein n=1 Tax=Thiorhodovibrio frisius TaxID=631362 RepID=H8YYF2_9GAMM|nr:hypothetical protein [Thiorhodovibrio frisius]EIC23478.1 hypothetical protein Thi970DRAFT_01149 [Thiorhodovibrio frisius]WPL23435.1 hypothetical protein Thiofri_03620 [Thiorhodovibrio frisius]